MRCVDESSQLPSAPLLLLLACCHRRRRRRRFMRDTDRCNDVCAICVQMEVDAKSNGLVTAAGRHAFAVGRSVDRRLCVRIAIFSLAHESHHLVSGRTDWRAGFCEEAVRWFLCPMGLCACSRSRTPLDNIARGDSVFMKLSSFPDTAFVTRQSRSSYGYTALIVSTISSPFD